MRSATGQDGQDQSLQHSGAQTVGGGQAMADLKGICPSVLLDARMKWRDIYFSCVFLFLCFFISLLLCFSASVLFCFSAYLLTCMLFCFSAFPHFSHIAYK